MPNKQLAFTPNTTDLIKFQICEKYVEKETGQAKPAATLRYAVAQLYKKAVKSTIDKDLVNKTIDEILEVSVDSEDPNAGISTLNQILERFHKNIAEKE